MIDAKEFLNTVRPALETADVRLLAHTLRVRWRQSQLIRLLRHDEADVRRVAAVAIGLVGDADATSSLTRALRDEDEQVNQMAEYGLWSIWFRAARPHAAKPFREGVALLTIEAHTQAIEKFREATGMDAQFSEAYNQCALAHYFLSKWKQSIANCCRTLRLVPTHFGALSGMGHCYAQLGDLPQALRCYRRALQIHPRMPAITSAVERIERQVPNLEREGGYLVDQIIAYANKKNGESDS